VDERPDLTGREREVMELLAEGLPNREIAATLCIELATVETHVHNILQKFQVANRTAATARWRETKGDEDP
jgi:DNA-binding NarL/FixJ family response regulator